MVIHLRCSCNAAHALCMDDGDKKHMLKTTDRKTGAIVTCPRCCAIIEEFE